MKNRALAIMGAAALAFGLILAPAITANAAPLRDASYNGSVYGLQGALNPTEAGYPNNTTGDGGYCLTTDGDSVGDHIVIGVCADAASQQFFPAWNGDVTAGGAYEYQLQLGANASLCITMNFASGLPDGQVPVLGDCIDAGSQIFAGIYTSWGPDNGSINVWGSWQAVDKTDANGNHIALNDAGNVLAPYTIVNTSYPDVVNGQDTVESEAWYLACPTDNVPAPSCSEY